MTRTLDIAFTIDGNSSDFTKDGWAQPECHGRWTNGQSASLRIPGLDVAASYACQVTLGPYVVPGKVPAQELKILVHGIEVYRTTMTQGGTIDFDVPNELVRLFPIVDIEFRAPLAVSPREAAGSDDVRVLGFSFWRLSLQAHETVLHRPIHDASVALRSPQKVAAVTMVYNEQEYLPIWLKHYAAQVGRENCFIVDHGSDDGSTENLKGCNVVRIPRSPYDPHKQSKFNSEFCNSLLNWYDWVVYSDVDEMVMADPAVVPTIREYCRRPLPEIVNAIGLNNIHITDAEPDIRPGEPVTAQRPYVFACSSMCKPILIRRPVVWSPGSHSADAPVCFDHLYMFHLRWYDLNSALRRLQRTRTMAWGRQDGGAHQRVDDERMKNSFRGFNRLPRHDDVNFDPRLQPLNGFLQKVLTSQQGRENSVYKIDLDIWPDSVWRLPKRFLNAF